MRVEGNEAADLRETLKVSSLEPLRRNGFQSHFEQTLKESSKVEQATAYFRPNMVNLYQFLLIIVVETRETLAQNHQLRYDIAVGEVDCWLDEPLMYRALANLLANAVTYLPAGSTVGLEVTREQNEIALSLSDQRIGIPQSGTLPEPV